MNRLLLKNKLLLANYTLIIVSVILVLQTMVFLISIFFQLNSFILPPDSGLKTTTTSDFVQEIIKVKHPITNDSIDFVFNTQMYSLKCDTLQQIKFWRSVMKLHQDTGFYNLPNTRQILYKVCVKTFDALSDSGKTKLKDSLRCAYLLTDTSRILLTSGKSFFYDFKKASANFDKGIKCFWANGVDPWYAQAILLIESPNKLQKSNAGAYGSFQLMKGVAKMYGLKINKQIDERADFERSAYAASSLIKHICIPYTRKILDSLGILNYNENDLWFKLLVMHSYHAGAGNVRRALFTFMPKEGNMDLIYRLWQTETKQFKSASQNYSQLILAAMFEVHDLFQVVPRKLDEIPIGK